MLSEPEIARHFISATLNILRTMAGLDPVAGKPYLKANSSAQGDVSALIGVTGDKRGTIAVSFSKPAAVELVRGMLGDDVQDIMQDVQDAVGELANMVSGQARASLAAAGVTMQGSTPSVILGDGHIIHHLCQARVMTIPFKTATGGFTVEFCFE